MDTLHSLTPWTTGDDGNNGRAEYVFRKNGECVADCEFSSNEQVNAANAALIVRAVNNHDALVKALEWICDNPSAHPYNIHRVARNALSNLRAEVAA